MVQAHRSSSNLLEPHLCIESPTTTFFVLHWSVQPSYLIHPTPHPTPDCSPFLPHPTTPPCTLCLPTPIVRYCRTTPPELMCSSKEVSETCLLLQDETHTIAYGLCRRYLTHVIQPPSSLPSSLTHSLHSPLPSLPTFYAFSRSSPVSRA